MAYHMLSNGILTNRQWGFRSWGYSTESLLLHLTESWVCALDRGHKVGVLFIDFRKAFDCVDHIILAEKLKAVGLAGDMWNWINDYLSNRMQGTSVNKSRSDRNLKTVCSLMLMTPLTLLPVEKSICTLTTPQCMW